MCAPTVSSRLVHATVFGGLTTCSNLHKLWCAVLGLKLIRETGANNPAIGYNVLPRWKD